jgi:ABC-type multidrug transport system fused ATPase/permease subunit
MGSQPQKIRWATFRRLFHYIINYWELKVILILVVLTSMLSVLTPAIIGDIIDMVKDIAQGTQPKLGQGIEKLTFNILLPIGKWMSDNFGINSDYGTLLILSFSLVMIAAMTGIFDFLQRYILEILSQRAGFDMRNDMYNSLLEQSFSFYDKQRTGQLMARATGDINMLGRFFSMGFRMALGNLLLLIMVLYSMLTLNIHLTMISVVILPFLMYTTLVYSKRVTPLWRDVRNQYGEITNVMQENLSGLRVVRGFKREEFEETKFGDECEKYFDINITLARIRSFFMPMASLISSIGIVIILWYGGNEVITGALSIGSMVAFYFYMTRLVQPVRMLGFMTSMFVRANAAAERVFEIIDAKVDVHDTEGAKDIGKVEGGLQFDHVYFSYDGENMVLKEINLDIKAGQTVAILGATGSGKSSIINLIPRFYDVSKGEIKLDGMDIKGLTIKSLRRNIGIVRQDPFIFSSTIRENIAYGVEEARLENITKAAKQANINEYIESLPDGYGTRVGERGVTLSGGQKQRIAIARALLKNPKILILDDSTSSVDTQTEYEIQQALDELLANRTTFIITQRLSSIKKADYIIVLEDGEIAEEGNHEDLMRMHGIYYKLYQTQVAGSVGGLRR